MLKQSSFCRSKQEKWITVVNKIEVIHTKSCQSQDQNKFIYFTACCGSSQPSAQHSFWSFQHLFSVSWVDEGFPQKRDSILSHAVVDNKFWSLRRSLDRNQHQNKHNWDKLLTNMSQYTTTVKLSQNHVNSAVDCVCLPYIYMKVCSPSLCTSKVNKSLKILKQYLDPVWQKAFHSSTSLFSLHNNVVPQIHLEKHMQMSVKGIQQLQPWMPDSSLARKLI